MSNKEQRDGIIMISPFLIGVVVFYLIPFIMSLYYCFTKGKGDVTFVGFENFIELFNNKAFILAVKNTTKFMIISIPLMIIISLAIAIVLNNQLKKISFFRTVSILPLVIPVASIILVWQIIFKDNGILNHMLSYFDIQAVDWINSKYSMYILIMLFIWKNSAYNIILFLVGLNNIPVSYYEAAKIDGCGSFRCFREITVKLLAPTTMFVFILSIVNSFNVYREAYLLAGEYPTKSLYMLQHFMNNNYSNLNYQRLSTAAFLVFSVIIILIYAIYKYRTIKGDEI